MNKDQKREIDKIYRKIYLVRPLETGLYSSAHDCVPDMSSDLRGDKIGVLSVSKTDYLECGHLSRQLIRSASCLVTTSPRVFSYLQENDLLTLEVLGKLCFLSPRSYSYFDTFYCEYNCYPQFVGDGTMDSLVSFFSKSEVRKNTVYLRGETVSFDLKKRLGLKEIVVYKVVQSEGPLLDGYRVEVSEIDFSAYFAFYSGSAVKFFAKMFARKVKAIAFGPSSEKELLLRDFQILATSSVKDETEVLKSFLR